MKLSEFKEQSRLRWDLLKANIRFTFLEEMAYAGNNWAGLASTTFYTISILIFLNIIFTNVKEVAGYNYQEMMILFFMSQMTFYFTWMLFMKNIYELIRDVNKGNLDLILTKPVPALFMLSFRRINLVSLIKEGLPPTMAIVLSIRWGEISATPINWIIGIVIWMLGIWVIHSLVLVAALPVFWLGESEGIVDLALQVSGSNGVLIPLEGYSTPFRITLSSIVPVLIASAFSASAILGKTDPWFLLRWAIVVAIMASIIRIKMWNLAIKNYTSASS